MSSTLESKIKDLQARLQAENEARERDRHRDKDLASIVTSPKHRPMQRPRELGDMARPEGTPTRPRKPMNLPVELVIQQKNQESGEIERKLQEIMKMNGILSINGKKYQTEIKDLQDLGELGNGTCGHVVKMLHKPSGTVIAVKQMRRSGNDEENKRIIMDLDVVLKSHDCPFIVQCLGCFITESDVWICMELMATCFDKLLKRLRRAIPEDILGKVTYATVKALHYLKEVHGVIHRDVKPSNILLDEKGNVKLCDFGISGRLVDSKARTRSAGCAAYMAPERIDPPDPKKPDYDIRADVWSLGITLVELATGTFPYKDCRNDFEVLARVLEDDPPSLPEEQFFSQEFRNFISCCLTKNYKNRPKYRKLLEHQFMKKYETASVDVAEWFARAKQQCEVTVLHNNGSPIRRFDAAPPSPSAKRHPSLISSHHRSFSESLHHPNGAGEQTDRVPPSYQYPRLGPGDLAVDAVQQGFWRTAPQGDEGERDAYRVVGSGFLGSPVPGRKRFPSEPPHHVGSTSPLVLQRFFHQQSQHQNNHYYHHHHLNSLVGVQQQPPCSPIHRPSPEPSPNKSGEDLNGGGVVKKRFASYIKFHLGSGDSRRNLPLCRAGRHASPGGQSPASRYPPASQSPEPPPRLSRISSVSSEGGTPQPGSSPLLLRRGFLDVSPVRKGFTDGSPSLSRRYISPSPPQPPPRRLSESTSVPGSPQHRRMEHIRARFHYTPEPQRKIFGATDVQDI